VMEAQHAGTPAGQRRARQSITAPASAAGRT